MAKQVTAQVIGGDPRLIKNVDDIKELRLKLDLGSDHSATVNGEPEDDSYELSDYEFVSFAPKVKGGC